MNENYIDIISKYLQGDITIEEKAALDLWIASDEENAKLFGKLVQTWKLSGESKADVTIDKAKAWKTIQKKIKEEQKVIPLNKEASKSQVWLWTAAAMFVLGLCATWFVFHSEEEVQMLVVNTTNQEKVILLSDSSVVTLNKNSTLKYPRVFSDSERHIDLEGEAFFEVTKNKERPFIISNKNFDVKVLGTSFNVLSNQNNREAVVSVVTGTVSFAQRNGEALVLIKNEVGVLDVNSHQLNKSTTSDANFLAWKTKQLQFNNTDFKEVVKVLETYFSKSIVVKNDKIYNCKFTSYFEKPTLEEVIHVLEKTLLLKIEVKDQQIIISGVGC